MAEPSSSVDWDVVRAELEGIDEVWKQARFDSLPHVVQVLTSQDPEGAVRTLQKQRDEIEELVDDVVRGYHNGFNKATHNYSQILRLFSESASSISGLKTNLGEARNLLGARHKQLHQQWCRSVTLRHVISLLDQIDRVAKVPSQIEKLIAEKKYYAAVQLYIQSISMLEREGIQSVGALQDVRADLSKLRGVLFFKVMEELHLHVYNKGEYSYNLTDIPDKDDDISNITAATVAPTGNLLSMSRRTRTMRRHDFQAAGLDRVLEARKGGSVDGSSVDGREDDASVANGGSVDGNSLAAANGHDESGNKEGKKPTRVLPPWLADSIPNEFTETMTKSDGTASVKYLQTMVECLALLGKIAAAGAIISQRLRPTLHELITAEIKARAAAVEASRPRVDQVSKVTAGIALISKPNGVVGPALKQKDSKNGNIVVKANGTSGPVTPLVGPMSKAQTAAQELLQSILSLALRILENHVVVGEAMEAKASVSDAASFSEKVNGDMQWGGDSDSNRATGGYSLVFALTVLQSECQQLICDILRATPDAASADAAVQTARLASKTPPDDAMRGGSEEGLSFAFRFTDTILTLPAGNDRMNQIMGSQGGRNRRITAAAQEGYGTGSVLPERGIYLTSAVYRPVLQYTDKVMSLLPPKYLQLGNDGLQNFIENFVKDQFLPIVRVDYRTRVADALASPAAFRLRSHPGTLYEPTVEKGRPVLQGPLAANELVKEVLGWAQAMPMYAGEILELVQTLLERTLERCRAGYTEAVLGSFSSDVIGRPDVSGLMKQEPANSVLEAGFLSQLGQKVSLDGPLDAEGLEVEMELNNLLLSLRPIKQEQLIKDNSKLVLLAALSDTLDFLSDSVQELGQQQSRGLTERRRKDQHQVRRHHRRTSSALTAGLGALADKFHALSSECLRTLRVEMQLQAISHLAGIGKVYVCDQDAEEPEDFIIAFTTQITRRDEEIAPYLPSLKRGYIFGGICSIAAATFIKSLNEMNAVNMLGIRQICRNCTAVQQSLASLGGSVNSVIERLDRVRTYYDLLNLPFEALVAFVQEHHSMFSFSEYSSLLKVHIPGREIPMDAVQRIGKIMAP
ncbi:exocyst complex component 4 [Marchantia polymorpha subsp. ruderalis]|uniref:Exocyst complex component Sec8 n=2 Tax=Marchantia polymorpha TaxID=3197 RepID=A0AAF6BST0_MARPO|nr:hypothetical protein MARPO_0170s0008 [Marchantia polymorpha]BBN15064.1 hypothetical protein Mp_6g16690 [Marchantia polymorpha subsp. ruderalis]|eukprot:PTQ28201.1 hypothetical protein MARPO_0170s0008 [Marchantia polymorpha]